MLAEGVLHMPQTYTIISFDGGNPLRCTMRRIGSIETHVHEFFELDMLLSGSCQVSSGSEVFTARADDVFSIEAHTPHSLVGADCTVVSVQFEQSFFERMLPQPKHPSFSCNSAVLGDSAPYHQLRRLIARLVKNNADRQLGYELRNWSLIYEIMDVMYQNFRVEDSEARNQRAHRYAARMADISRIIGESYRDNLTLSELADRVHLSAPYLSKFIEKQFGVTFLAYLTRVRLDHALGDLLKTNDTIETISANAGFPNSNAFVQAFRKEYGVLPSIYRRKAHIRPKEEPQPMQIEQHDYMAGLRKYLEVPKGEAPIQASSNRVSVSLKAQGKTLAHNWRELSGVPSASSLLLSDVQDLLRRVQREIGFRYIKFNGIFSDDMRVYFEDGSGAAQYSFAYVDKAFDFLLSVGLRPFVQLGFMPEALARENKKLFGYLVSEPNSYEKWAALVSASVEHLIRRYGPDEVRRWRFSVWHQPDTPESMFGFRNTEDFYRFYQVTRQAVKDCDAAIPFGAPATYYFLQDGYQNWYIPFLQWSRENDCAPDFLNFNYYELVFNERDSGQEAFGFTQSMALRETAEGFDSFVMQALSERHMLAADKLPLYLSEWNNTPSQQDLLNDTCFKSCYIAKCILENYDKLDSFAYWSLTDWMGEAAQPKDMYFGGLGLFTANGVPKASYMVFTLLRRLGDTLLGKGEGWFITRKGASYQIMLYHYRHFSHLYALGERFDMTFTDRYTPFSPEQMLDVHLVLKDCRDGEYIVTETIVNRASGSSFDQWVAMGAEELTEPGELDTLAARSTPAINKYTVSAEGGALRLDAMLDMLEVRLIDIKRR